VPISRELLSEFELQAPLTRKFLERVPNDKLTWKPHDKSMTLGQLAYHLAYVPSGIAQLVGSNPAPAPERFEFPQPATVAEILKTHDEGVATVKNELAKFDDRAMNETWRLRHGEYEVLAMPRLSFVRDIMLSHWYQHRGQMSVYLRMLNIPVPSTWGPSADEAPAWMQQQEQVMV
jgi:uncharacterized damage-inducible protein DinB